MLRTRSIGRAIGLSLSVMLAAVLLTGCDLANQHQGPVSVRVVAGELEIAICDSMTATGFAAFHAAAGGEWSQFIKSTGDSEIAAGSIVTVSTIGSYFPSTSIAREPDLADGSRLNVLVYGAAPDSNMTASFGASSALFEGASWLHPDGSLSAERC